MGFAIAENLLDFESPVAKLFVSEDTGVHSLKKGLPSLGTMINFLLIGTSGLFFTVNLKSISKLLRITGLIVTIIGAIGIIGYLISQPVMYYEVESISGAMAFHTAILFALSGVAILCYSFVKSYVPFQTLTKQEYIWLAGITITPGIFIFLLKMLESLSTTYRDFFGEMMYLASILVIISVIMIFQRIIHTHNNLDNTIQKRTELIQNQIEELKEIDRLKTEFLNMISHELKTPLTPIKIYSSSLKRPKLLGELNKKQADAVDGIHFNTLRLERLIGDLLDVQNLELDRMIFDYSKFKVDELMRQVCKKFESEINERKIQLVNTTQDSIVIKSDEARIKQVLEHLMDNAIAFVPQENGKIEIGAQEADDSVSFFVKDNGVGIPKEKQENLFKKFYQVSSGHTREHGGVGLGISICKGIITKLGGKIWLESEVGKGTTFFFTIPKAE